MNYTKGEWQDVYIGQGIYNVILNSNSDDVIAVIDNYDEYHAGDGDAHLISAAPDMYEALKTAKDALRTLLYEHPDDDIGKAQMEVIDKALAEAEGK